ncbi:DUF3216 domain-containing protein [Thermococcus alcaliphilus]|uniref:DUF3216 domain-containing protein n=1 Tax=Thermococcus alcaliphilus TaxID=139207 RepID=UPI00209182F6|nr:DUF3216 domain-containing protein [Thermococcus alcaliphilus]MCO6041656.1 DUF3216 domain-containing protein [Thermococcus alcaliphilus]
MEEVERVKALCKELNEEHLLKAIDSFVSLQKELSSKKGEDFINVSILGFIEGILVSLSRKHENEKIGELLEEVRAKRAELEEKFKKPRVPLFENP